MEENKLIKFEYGALQKVGNAIAISNKLIAEKYFEKANDLQYKQRKYEDANVFYLKAIELIPNYIDALNNIAQNLRLNFRNYQDAILYYSKVIELNPKYEAALFRRAMCKESLGDHVGRIQDLTSIIDYEPSAENYIRRARARQKINDHQGVIEDCNSVISLDNLEQSAYTYRGIAKTNLSDFQTAIDDFETAIGLIEQKSKLHPDYRFSSWFELTYCGKAKIAIQDFKGALDVFEQLVFKYPENPISYRFRAHAKEKLGDLMGYKDDIDVFKIQKERHIKKYGLNGSSLLNFNSKIEKKVLDLLTNNFTISNSYNDL